MKTVVPYPLDPLEKLDIPEEKVIVDEDAFCYFRDEVFIKNIKKFIEKKARGKLKNEEDCDGAERWRRNSHNIEVIHKYYRKYAKIRDKYYLYKDDIYIYVFMGFGNIGAEIQLMKLEKKDILFYLNNPKKPFMIRKWEW